VAERTLGRLWWHYFLEFGFTPAEARKRHQSGGKERRNWYLTKWTEQTSTLLKSIVDD
jgi:hypothetical protein